VGNPWLDAGIVPYSTIRPPDDMHNLSNGYPFNKDYWKEWFPADFITECFPGQFRNWFYAILTMSTVLENKPPFKVLLGYASLRDEHGEEMHKSKGNAIWSDEAAEKVGADVMRWMFAKHNPVQNLNFGYGPAKEIKRTLLTLWNVYSFFVTYANIDNFNPLNKKINEKALTKLDRWIFSRLNSLILDVDKLYENYELMTIVKLAEKFFDDLSNWYVRRSRRRFWKSENDADKETAYLVLYECLVKLLKIISPIMPFWTEEMYQNLVRSVDKDAPPSIHLCDFPKVENEKIDEKLENEISLTRTIVSLGRAARNKVNIKIRQPLAEMFIMVPETSPQLSEADRKTILYIFTATPVFEKLGPKFGKLANRVGDWIKSLSNEKVEELIKSGSLKQDFDGRTIEITKEDVQIRKKEASEVSIMIEGEYGVGLKTVLTKELENEGMVRELIHKIQLLRKEADFNLVDRIKIFYQTEPRLKEAIVENLDYLKNETLATEVTEGTEPGEINKTVDINGVKAKISLRRNR